MWFKLFSSTFSYNFCSATNSVIVIHYLRGRIMQQKAKVNLGAFRFQQPISQENVKKKSEHKKWIWKDIWLLKGHRFSFLETRLSVFWLGKKMNQRRRKESWDTVGSLRKVFVQTSLSFTTLHPTQDQVPGQCPES